MPGEYEREREREREREGERVVNNTRALSEIICLSSLFVGVLCKCKFLLFTRDIYREVRAVCLDAFVIFLFIFSLLTRPFINSS